MSDIRNLPAQSERVETGPVRFGDDWPGVFIRGDNAFGYAGALSAVVRNGEVSDPFQSVMLRSLLELLTTSDLTGISQRDAGVSAPDGQTFPGIPASSALDSGATTVSPVGEDQRTDEQTSAGESR